MATSSTSSSSSTFNGSSQYAAQLQQVITHSIAIASLPMQQLQSQQTTLTSQKTELQNLTSLFAPLQAAAYSLESSTGAGAFSATVSDTSVANASVSSGAMAGTYNLNVTSLGSQTSTLSSSSSTTVTDPSTANIDSSSSYTLTLNGTSYSISDPSGTLNGLAQAITNSSANVQATVVNVGSSTSPDYRLSVQSLNYAPDTIQLSDSSNNNLLSTLATGSNVTYELNGLTGTPIDSSSRSITVSPGLTVNLQGTGTTQIAVSESASGAVSALSSFASAYNSLMTELNNNRGQNNGALTGQSIVYELQDQLRDLVNYSSSDGSNISLASLGLTFDDTGALDFDSDTFDAAISQSPSNVLNFLGSSTSGFIQAANDSLSSITDSSTGTLATASNSISNELSDLSSKISDDQTNISNLQATLNTQMATADSAISTLQNQLTEVTDLFAAMQANEKANS